MTDTTSAIELVEAIVDARDHERRHAEYMRKAKARGRARGRWEGERMVGWIEANSYALVYGAEEGRRLIEQKLASIAGDLKAAAPGWARDLRAQRAGMRAFLRGEPMRQEKHSA